MNDRNFEKPVAWLLGKQLLGGIKGMLLYTAYGEKLDPRDWMSAKEIPFDAEGKEDFWFDYLSDAGDGSKAMYTIAYLTLSSVWTKLDKNTLSLPADEDQREVITLKKEGDDVYKYELPRGRFLFIGGDTCYHSADYLSLVDRVQRPFVYAYQDLKKRKLIDDTHERRPVFGIPGNHDYYDQVDGFRRQFRKPTRPEGPLPPEEGPYKSGRGFASLTLAGFKRVQEATYVALRLPFNWWLWGLDTEPGLIDLRQREFFSTLKTTGEQAGIPKKLIVATCSPSTVFGRVAELEELKATKSMLAVGLKVPFAARNAGDKPDLTKSGDAALDEGQCRLDLSGDVHHYARYWGPQAKEKPRKQCSAERPAAKHYASVVSGAGGAFHHPSTTYDDEICEQVLYPSEDRSRETVGNTLFKFWNVMNGGYIWLAGFIMAFVFYFCITAPQSSRQFISNIGIGDSKLINALDVTGKKTPETITATIVYPDAQPCAPVKPFALWSALGLVQTEWQPPANCSPAAPGYLFAMPATWQLDLILGDVFIGLSVAAILLTFYLAVFTEKIFTRKSPWEDKSVPEKRLIPIVAITGALVLIALLSIQPYRYHITPFINSLLVLYSVAAAVTAIMLNIRYSEYLFKKSFVPKDKNARLLNFVQEYFPWVLWLLAIVVLTVGLWFFGKNNLPAYLVSDITFIVVLIAAIAGIIALPFKVAGDLLYTKSKWVQRIGKAAIGVWFLILQLLVPLILILNANWIMLALAAILVVAPIPLAQFLFKRNSRFALTLLWLVYGAVMLRLPWITDWALRKFAGYQEYPLIFTNSEGWFAVIPAILAGIIGAVICCLWTGWYFAVTFLFNGHNNEVGGTARVENFKQFIRFRLTNDSITGYVIAVDDVSRIGEEENGRTLDGSDLKVQLIDVFHLVPKPAAVTAPKNTDATTPASVGARS